VPVAAPFDAFISYSRRASSTLATDLQTAVERFAKPWYRLRAIRVFRDDASMSANTALWSNIEQGLRQSEWFVLIASPAAAASQYVANEVTWWLQHKSADRIIIVLEEGVDIAWDRGANDFDWARTDSLPRALSGAFAEEPRWIDVRWYEADGSLRKTDPRWNERVADIAAAVRFTERDQLIGENVREHRKAQRLLRAGIVGLSLLLVASLVATVVAIGQRSEARRQTRIAVEQREAADTQARIALARQLAAQAVSLAPTDLRTASLLAVQAFRTNDDAQTRAALFQLATASPRLVRVLPVGADVTATAVTPDGVVVTGDAEGRVQVWHGAAPTTLATLSERVTSVAISADASVVVAAAGTAVIVSTAGEQRELGAVKEPVFVAVAGDGSRVAATSPNSPATWVWTLSANAPPRRLRSGFSSELAFGEAGLSSFGSNGEFALFDTDSGAVLRRGGHAFSASGVAAALSADGTTMTGSLGGADLPVWRGERAYADNAEPNYVASTETFGGEIELSASGSAVASLVDGLIEVAAVRAPSDPFVRPVRLEGAGRAAESGTLSFGGERFVVNGSGASALLWDLQQGFRFGKTLDTYVPEPCGACGLQDVEVAPDGRRVLMWALGATEGGPVVTDLESGAEVRLGAGSERVLEALSWVDDEGLVGFDATASEVVTVDSGNGDAAPLAELTLEDGDFVIGSASAGGRDGRAVLLTMGGAVFVVDLASGEVVDEPAGLAGRFELYDVAASGIAPDLGTLFVEIFDLETSQETVVVLDLATDRVLYDGPGTGAAYDSRSRLHVFEGDSARVLGEDGELGPSVPAPADPVPAPVLDPEGELLVTGGRESDIRLLDLTSHASLLGTIEVPQQNGIYPVSSFSPDGSALVTAIPPMFSLGLPSVVRRISLDPADWITAACAVAARDLTEDDWARYGVGEAPSDLRCVQ
jgi:WD40 repeat protein